MGRKRKRFWQHILFFSAACLIILHLITGCRPTVEQPDLQGEQGGIAGPSDSIEVPEMAAQLMQLEESLLDKAEVSLQKGDIPEALQSISEAISCCEGQYAARAFDLIEMALVHPDNKRVKLDNAQVCLQQAENQFTKSGYGINTSCWVIALSDMLAKADENRKLKNKVYSQKQEVKTLKKIIERLKAVDLEPMQEEIAVEEP